MRDNDAQLIWEAMPDHIDRPAGKLPANYPQTSDPALANLSQRIDILQQEVDQLKIQVDENNLKGLILSVISSFFPWLMAHPKTRKQ